MAEPVAGDGIRRLGEVGKADNRMDTEGTTPLSGVNTRQHPGMEHDADALLSTSFEETISWAASRQLRPLHVTALLSATIRVFCWANMTSGQDAPVQETDHIEGGGLRDQLGAAIVA